MIMSPFVVAPPEVAPTICSEPVLGCDPLDPGPRHPRQGERAFADLVARTERQLTGLARSLVVNDEDAADVVQEAYMRAWRALPAFRGEAQLSTWLHAITANTARTHLRRRLQLPVEPMLEGHDLPDAHPDADPQAAVEGADLHAAIDALPPSLRVVLMSALHGLPHRLVADHLGISPSAAKVRLHRARRRLQQALAPSGGSP